MRSVVEEKSSRIVEILLSSIRPAELLAGKILGVAFVGLTQYLIWIALSSAALRGCAGTWGISSLLSIADNPEHVLVELLPAMVGFFVLGYLLYACLYALVGSLASQPSDTQQLQLPITMMLLVPIVLLPWALSMPNDPVVRALSFVPFFSPILMFCRIAVSGPAVWESVLSVVLLLLAVGIAWRFSARVYRVAILLYGKRITLREVARWIHYG
jgi:ABC-2 type transport system permease protein